MPGSVKGYLKAIEAEKAIPMLIEEVKKFTIKQGDNSFLKKLAEDPYRIFNPDTIERFYLEYDDPVLLEKALQIERAIEDKNKVFKALKLTLLPPIGALVLGTLIYLATWWIIGGFSNEKLH